MVGYYSAVNKFSYNIIDQIAERNYYVLEVKSEYGLFRLRCFRSKIYLNMTKGDNYFI